MDNIKGIFGKLGLLEKEDNGEAEPLKKKDKDKANVRSSVPNANSSLDESLLFSDPESDDMLIKKEQTISSNVIDKESETEAEFEKDYAVTNDEELDMILEEIANKKSIHGETQGADKDDLFSTLDQEEENLFNIPLDDDPKLEENKQETEVEVEQLNTEDETNIEDDINQDEKNDNIEEQTEVLLEKEEDSVLESTELESEIKSQLELEDEIIELKTEEFVESEEQLEQLVDISEAPTNEVVVESEEAESEEKESKNQDEEEIIDFINVGDEELDNKKVKGTTIAEEIASVLAYEDEVIDLVDFDQFDTKVLSSEHFVVNKQNDIEPEEEPEENIIDITNLGEDEDINIKLKDQVIENLEAEEIVKPDEKITEEVIKDEIMDTKTNNTEFKIDESDVLLDFIEENSDELNSLNLSTSSVISGSETIPADYYNNQRENVFEDVERKIDRMLDSYDRNKAISIDEIYKRAMLQKDIKSTIFMAEIFAKALPENLPLDVKKESVINIMNVSDIDIDLMLEDAYLRIDALNRVQENVVKTTNETKMKNNKTIASLEKQIESLKQMTQARERFQEEQNTIIEYEMQRIISILDFVKNK